MVHGHKVLIKLWRPSKTYSSGDPVHLIKRSTGKKRHETCCIFKIHLNSVITFADGRSPILMRTLRLIFWIKQWTKLSLSLVAWQNKKQRISFRFLINRRMFLTPCFPGLIRSLSVWNIINYAFITIVFQ